MHYINEISLEYRPLEYLKTKIPALTVPIRELIILNVIEKWVLKNLCTLTYFVGKPNFNDQFKKSIKRYTKVGYNLDVMRKSACLVLNPITVYCYGFLFNCMTVGQSSDSMTALA